MPELCRSNRSIFSEDELTWDALYGEAVRRFGDPTLLTAQRSLFAVSSQREALSAVILGIRAGLDFAVAEQTRLDESLRERLDALGMRIVARDAAPGEGISTPGRISVLTSGTTGAPKMVPHTSESLNTFDRVRELPPNRWFMPYQVGSYAWYQMVALSLFVPGQDLIPGNPTDLTGSFEAALHKGEVTAISSTPTFWRHALMTISAETLAAAPIRSISMGGEIVDQAILDRLSALYPGAAIRHIYASSEAGAAIVVTDGKAGFDAALLDRPSEAVTVRVVDGRLQVRSRYGNRTEQDAWIDTGDLVELREERVYFRGRADNQLINVGGQKAFPAAIEAHLLSYPEVAWAQVVGRRAPLMGYLPVANIVLKRPIDPIEAESLLTRHCEDHLAEYAIPRIWNFLDEVPLRASLKS